METEAIWYPIPGFPGYEFSSDFQIRSWHTKGWRGGPSDRPRLLSTYRQTSGYLAVHMRVAGKAKCIYLHDIVAALAYGAKPNGAVVRHCDDNKENNYPSNLIVGDRKGNSADARRNGRAAVGERCGSSKLTADRVREIRILIADGGHSLRSIARTFGINISTLIALRDGKTWAHVA